LGSALSTLRPSFSSQQWDLLIPMPASRSTLRKRGFNQCEVLAEQLRKHLTDKSGTRPSISEALRFQIQRAPHAQLTHEKRFTHLTALYRVTKALQPGMRVLLVEDVVTTGASSSAAAHALIRAGASSVDLIALARAGTWRRLRPRVSQIFNR
jgi:predicted amidophosphoribosyltransferase